MSKDQEHRNTERGRNMLKPFLSQKQYFAGWSGMPVVYDDGATWVPSSLGVHRNGDEVLYENHWIRGGDHMQLEFPWGCNYETIKSGNALLHQLQTSGEYL